MRQLTEAVASLDAAQSLGDVLDRLVRFGGRDVARSALLMLKGGRLQEWRMVGFGATAPARKVDLSLDEAGLPGVAARERRAIVSLGDDGPPLPPFAAAGGVRDAAAVPLTVDGLSSPCSTPTPRHPTRAEAGGRWRSRCSPVMRAACSKLMTSARPPDVDATACDARVATIRATACADRSGAMRIVGLVLALAGLRRKYVLRRRIARPK